MEELVARQIAEGIRYEALPDRIKAALPFKAWQDRVKVSCIQRGLPWVGTLACAACSEDEYYEQLVKTYKLKQRLYPYHVAHHVAAKLRVTPFKYYYDVIYHAMRNEAPYDQIPNFTAAEIVRLIGVGRNEYIAKLNACKDQKLLWRVNKAIAKEHLPAEPLPVKLLPWWRVHAVVVSEKEFRDLTKEEEALLRQCARARDGAAVADCAPDVLQAVHRRHLVYVDVPVAPEQRFSTSSLEGFVSNRDMVAGDGFDPMEAMLYELFVSNSERMTVEALSHVLDKPVQAIQHAMSMACRLGFATRLEGDGGRPGADGEPDSPASAGAGQAAVAVVLDAEATSYLMMGSLSPGMKKHSVTLFEGGRLAGEQTIQNMRTELRSSVEAGASFEGEMSHIVGVLESLATILDTLCAGAAHGCPVEVIRKESLSSLAAGAASRMLQLAYVAVLAIEPLPLPALPIPLAGGRGPALFGASAAMLSPWILLALLAELRQGPVCIAFTHGQRVTVMPPQAHGCSHVLLWPWEPEKWPAKDMGQQAVPHLVSAKFALYLLNGLLSCSAVLAQPLWLHGEPPIKAGASKTGFGKADVPLAVALIPLPLQEQPRDQHHAAAPDGSLACTGLWLHSHESASVRVPRELPVALEALGLHRSVGYLWAVPSRLCSLPGSEPAGGPEVYVPYHVSLGLPLYNAPLCKQVCRGANESGVLTQQGMREQVANQEQLLESLVRFVGSCIDGDRADASVARLSADAFERQPVVFPPCRLVFDGHAMSRREGWADTQQSFVPQPRPV